LDFCFPIAFGFANIALLGWLAAAAVPLLIHLWMRHTHRDTPWAAIEFLRQAIKRNARRLRLQQWILLALRTLIIVLLVLAAAKPFLSGQGLLGGGPTVHRLLVFDTTMSMQYESGGQTHFDRARQRALELIEEAAPSGLFSVATMGTPPRPIVARPTGDRHRLKQEIGQLQPSSGTVQLADTLRLVENMIAEARRDNREVARHEVILLSDMAAHPWQEAVVANSGSPTDPTVNEQLLSIAKLCNLVVLDVGDRQPTNTALSELSLAGSIATTAEPVPIAAQLTNYGSATSQGVLVQLLLDGIAIDEQSVTLAPLQSTTLTFEVPFDSPGWHELSVRTTGDQLTADDQAYLAIEVPERVRILCVEGEPRAARYVARALNPSGEPTSPLEPVVIAEGSLTEMALDEFACVFLCNVGRLAESEVATLSRFVEKGGGLIVFLGNRVLADAYNESLVGGPNYLSDPFRLVALQPAEIAEEAPTRSLLPAMIGPTVSSENVGINPLEYSHPIMAAFQGRERSGLLTTPISTYMRLEPLSRPNVVVALATSSGDPLLVTQSFGQGMVALVATAASLDVTSPDTGQPWTLWPAWPSFLPIVRELVSFTSSASQQGHAALVWGELKGELPPYWTASTLAMVRPDGRVDILPAEREGHQVSWTYQSTDLPGVYSARAGEKGPTMALAAVNVDPRESDVTRVDVKNLSPVLSAALDRDSEGLSDNSLSASNSMHRWLLYGVLALLLVESTFAWWFGRSSR
jgi:hypothetical protein